MSPKITARRALSNSRELYSSSYRINTRQKPDLDIWYTVSADNKRCHVRRATRTSSGRPRRPALVAAANTNSMVYTAKHAESGGIEQ